MLDKLIFNLEDVQGIRKVSSNIDDFAMYAQEVQRNFLQKLLGDKLYTALQIDLDSDSMPQNARFETLINGEIYTEDREIIFRGIKLYCSYLWMYLYMSESSVNLTPIGAQLFKDEYAENAESKQSFRQARDHYINSADGMEEPILRYLTAKNLLFPEFNESSQIQTAKESNLSFRVVGKSYSAPNEFLR
jgi:hypothetical protein